MCPLCVVVAVSTVVAQVLFFVSLGIFLVVITDLKFGAPLSLASLALTGSKHWGGYTTPDWVLYAIAAVVIARAIWVLTRHKQNWVRRRSIRLANWLQPKLWSIIHSVKKKVKAQEVVP